ncbi:MAG: agmatine deiminase family protein [Chitinophagales bacterium]|nr:agmatine deiminase family protein [Bacteroidota bacterium]MCB9043441.1 agmatine deiminase family protein [Chitinophagales bacterium]
MKKFFTLIAFIFISSNLQAQQNMPHSLLQKERNLIPDYLRASSNRSNSNDAPPLPVRTPAEWEEAQALLVAWTSYPEILAQIIQYAQEEVPVYVVTTNPTQVTNFLSNADISTDNVYFIEQDFNSIWIRDYGPWSVYANEVDSLWIADWIYNRPRPKDDVIPQAVATAFDLPIFEAVEEPEDLVHTGGNFMVDGWGTGFSSSLIVEENPDKTVEDIDNILHDYLGIDRQIIMEKLPYDGIHHIDMHMKLLDEETLLVGEYPNGVADGPQIEANIAYIQQNYPNAFGKPYKIIRIPMPPENGLYPDTFGDYRTYTNAIFINKTLLVPTYEETYDTTALRILQENLPGYKVKGINCNDIIPSLGALHCITKLVMSDDPLWISHQKVQSSYNLSTYPVNAYIANKEGVSGALVHYRVKGESEFSILSMQTSDTENWYNWTAQIPYYPSGTTIEYYIEAFANSGKSQRKPISAPEGFYKFTVTDDGTVGLEDLYPSHTNTSLSVLPNPASTATLITLKNIPQKWGKVSLLDFLGREISIIEEGIFANDNLSIPFSTLPYANGIYFIKYETQEGFSLLEKIIIHQ